MQKKEWLIVRRTRHNVVMGSIRGETNNENLKLGGNCHRYYRDNWSQDRKANMEIMPVGPSIYKRALCFLHNRGPLKGRVQEEGNRRVIRKCGTKTSFGAWSRDSSLFRFVFCCLSFVKICFILIMCICVGMWIWVHVPLECQRKPGASVTLELKLVAVVNHPIQHRYWNLLVGFLQDQYMFLTTVSSL